MAEDIRGIPFDANSTALPDGTIVYDNIIYSADFAEWLGTYFKNGVLVPKGAMISTELQVTNPDDTHLNISVGNIVVNGRTGFVTEAVTMETVAAAPDMYRKDRVVVELNLEENTNGFQLKLVAGTEAATAEAPKLIRTDEVYQMSLATVNYDYTGITSIVDDRVDESLCGISQVLIGVRTPMPVTGDSADNISYDGSASGLSGQTVQDAIDELVSKTYTATVPITGWSGSAAPYSIDVTITGMLESDNPIVDMVPSATYETAQSQADAWGEIYKITAGTNKITLYSNSVPKTEVPIQLKVVR
jgi:hypothetical protein